jgi:hypothetical protein
MPDYYKMLENIGAQLKEAKTLEELIPLTSPHKQRVLVEIIASVREMARLQEELVDLTADGAPARDFKRNHSDFGEIFQKVQSLVKELQQS